MNKKGFTLIEILGVIVIIGLLLLIVAPNLLNRINPKEEEISNLQEEMIKEAAGLYADAHKDECASGCDINTNILIQEGYLNDNIKDIKENKYINKQVHINNNHDVTITD